MLAYDGRVFPHDLLPGPAAPESAASDDHILFFRRPLALAGTWKERTAGPNYPDSLPATNFRGHALCTTCPHPCWIDQLTAI